MKLLIRKFPDKTEIQTFVSNDPAEKSMYGTEGTDNNEYYSLDTGKKVNIEEDDVLVEEGTKDYPSSIGNKLRRFLECAKL